MLRGPILIVEDDLEDQEIMREVFDELQISNELKFFTNGNAVLEFLRATKEKPFLIITDINLHGLNGLELREEIMKDELLRKKSIPFIFLSTSDGKQIIEKVYELQVQGYFQKQTSFGAIKEQVKLIVAYWQACRHPNS